jgi:hypothetical protein
VDIAAEAERPPRRRVLRGLLCHRYPARILQYHGGLAKNIDNHPADAKGHVRAYCSRSSAWELAEDPRPRLALFLVC